MRDKDDGKAGPAPQPETRYGWLSDVILRLLFLAAVFALGHSFGFKAGIAMMREVWHLPGG